MSRIISTRRWCRFAEQAVVRNTSTMAFAWSAVTWPDPSVSTFAPLCSRLFLASASL